MVIAYAHYRNNACLRPIPSKTIAFPRTKLFRLLRLYNEEGKVNK
jgi:hypothetical protein